MIPCVSPTVPMAEAVSKIQSFRQIPSTELITHPPARNRVIYMVNTVAAVVTVSPLTRLPKKQVCSRLRKTEREFDRNIIVNAYLEGLGKALG